MRDIIPIIRQDKGQMFIEEDMHYALHNCVPVILENGEIGARPRYYLADSGDYTADSNSRGRGVKTIDGSAVWLDDDTYYYSLGASSQNLKATTAPGYAGNTGHDSDFVATFVDHLISGDPNIVIVNAGDINTHASAEHGNVWYVPNRSTAPASISDANMPGNNGVSLTRGGASLGGYFFLGDITGKIYNSNLNDITTWTATDFLTSETSPDTGIYIGKHHDNIVYIGNKSMDFYYNAGNSTGSPLSPRQDVKYRVGCPFPNSVLEKGDVIYFVGANENDYVRVYKLENFQLTPISDPKLESQLNTPTSGVTGRTNTAVNLYPRLAVSGQTFSPHVYLSYATLNNGLGLVLTVESVASFYYDILTGIWSRVDYGSSSQPQQGGIPGSWINILPITNADLASNLLQMADGRLAEFVSFGGSAAAINELGDNNGHPESYMIFPRWDGGTNRKKRINSIHVLTRSTGSKNANYAPIPVDLRWFDYDIKDRGAAALIQPPGIFTTGRSIEMSARTSLKGRLGVTRERQFMLDWTQGSGNAAAILGLEIDYDVVGE